MKRVRRLRIWLEVDKVDVHVGSKVNVSVGYLPAGALPDGIPLWTIAPNGLASLFPATDGKSCFVLGMVAGTATVSVAVDTDRTAAGKTILTRTFPVNVLAPPLPIVTDLAFTFGAEVPNV